MRKNCCVRDKERGRRERRNEDFPCGYLCLDVMGGGGGGGGGGMECSSIWNSSNPVAYCAGEMRREWC